MAERIRVKCDICGKEFEVEGPEYPLYICPECDREKWEEDDENVTLPLVQ